MEKVPTPIRTAIPIRSPVDRRDSIHDQNSAAHIKNV